MRATLALLRPDEARRELGLDGMAIGAPSPLQPHFGAYLMPLRRCPR